MPSWFVKANIKLNKILQNKQLITKKILSKTF